MSSASHNVPRSGTSNANNRTTTTTTQAGPSIPFNFSGTLRLRAASDAEREQEPSNQRRIQWADDVIDNEGMGKKSSKGVLHPHENSSCREFANPHRPVCCIYHKPREAGESSSESSSSSSDSDDSDSEADTSRAQPANRSSRRQGHRHQHSHDHSNDEPCEHDHAEPDAKAKGKQKERKRSPNAYERVPKRKQPKEPK